LGRFKNPSVLGLGSAIHHYDALAGPNPCLISQVSLKLENSPLHQAVVNAVVGVVLGARMLYAAIGENASPTSADKPHYVSSKANIPAVLQLLWLIALRAYTVQSEPFLNLIRVVVGLKTKERPIKVARAFSGDREARKSKKRMVVMAGVPSDVGSWMSELVQVEEIQRALSLTPEW
jgi:hypothetical protein